MGFVWVLIPIAAICAGAFSEWLKFKKAQIESTANLTGEVGDLSDRLIEMDRERQNLVERIQNLETIVTSQMYDEVVEPEGRIKLDEDDLPEKEQITRIARRIRS